MITVLRSTKKLLGNSLYCQKSKRSWQDRWRKSVMNNKENDNDKERFLYPLRKYYGKFTPENFVFNANLQEFAQRISYLCNLESNGKISTQNAYDQIKALWQQLDESQESLLNDKE